jgi:hypothetical protein
MPHKQLTSYQSLLSKKKKLLIETKSPAAYHPFKELCQQEIGCCQLATIIQNKELLRLIDRSAKLKIGNQAETKIVKFLPTVKTMNFKMLNKGTETTNVVLNC